MDAGNQGKKAEAAPARGAAQPIPARPDSNAGLRAGLFGLAGALLGAGVAWFAAAAHFDERSAAVTQASELRVRAADQRIGQLQEQVKQLEEQSQRREQDLVQEADAQQIRAVRQVSEQDRALAQQQRAQLDAARQHEQQVAEAARQREQELARPDLPVRVWVHRPLSGRGLVASMHNFGAKDVPVTLTTLHAASGLRETWTAVLPANANQLIGAEPGMPIGPGDDIQVASEGYRPFEYQVPQRRAAAPAAR
jgi:multidrug efflux pump subunit AcrA (membrane-fusion protein)